MPGVYQLSPDMLLQDLKKTWSGALHAILLFGIPDKKDRSGRKRTKKNA